MIQAVDITSITLKMSVKIMDIKV